jgi:tetratricopeptide (TPR) repeat protein
MRKLLILAGLVCAGACVPPHGGGKLPKAALYYPRVTIPARITDGSYKTQRDVYDALPTHTPGRDAYRALLLDHLLRRAKAELDQQRERDGLKTFIAAATLFHPIEIYRGQVRQDGLSALAARLVALLSPRGDEEGVVLPLCVQMSLRSADTALPARFAELAQWTDETQQLAHGRVAKGALLVKVLEKTVRVWPSPFVVEELRKLYIDRRLTLSQVVGGAALRHLRNAFPSSMLDGGFLETGYKTARLYLRVGRLYDALTRVRELTDDASQDTELRQLLELAASPSTNVKDHVRLAEFFEERDRDVGLRICEDATERFPEQAAAFECVGRLAASRDRFYLAVTSLERALQLAPDKQNYAEALARHYQRRLFEMIGDEQLDEARRELEQIEAFYGRCERRFKQPLKPPLGRVYYAVGHGYYNAGRIGLAVSAFERSVALEPTPDALVQLATIRVKRGDAAGAEQYLARAEKSSMATPQERIFWQGRVEGLRGKALAAAGRADESKAALRRAVESWREWQALGLRPEARAEAYVFEAQALFGVGERGRAIDALERAIDVQPERKETYADVMALLTTYGHLPEALDAFHRALGRAEVSEYLKTYCSFWVVGLATRASQRPDPLALEHLRTLRGDQWYVQLAQLLTGAATYEQVEARAKTVGNRAELHYYRADQLVAAGKLAEARALWQRVVGSEMMAFYEYDMASQNLRLGPAKVATRPLDRQQNPNR